MVLLWGLSLMLRDASIVDVFWGLGFVSVYWIGYVLVHSSANAIQPIRPDPRRDAHSLKPVVLPNPAGAEIRVTRPSRP